MQQAITNNIYLHYFLSINLITILLYGYDKAIALVETKRLSRVSEFTLLILALLGGFIGALIAMLVFRHKIKKSSFVWKFVGVMILHVGVIGVYLCC